MLKRTVVTIEESALDQLRAIKNSERTTVCASIRRAVTEYLARRDAKAAAIQKRKAGR